MAEIDTIDPHDSEHGRGSGGAPTSPRRLRLPLATLDDVARELARVYRSARAGDIKAGDATRLAFILSTLGKVIEAAQFEARITALEEVAYEQSGSAN